MQRETEPCHCGLQTGQVQTPGIIRSDLSVFDQRCNVFCRSYNGEPAYSLRGAEVVLLYNMLRAAIMRG